MGDITIITLIKNQKVIIYVNKNKNIFIYHIA